MLPLSVHRIIKVTAYAVLPIDNIFENNNNNNNNNNNSNINNKNNNGQYLSAS